ncbi:MAG TPA: CDP-glycerol glycerophosphotransferase family protein [Solirubrobacteraceae bacterium]|jgi:CDP-glycerol glycerophosphotransferase|nr:CDP-glycerol glycerophosphotransferase family protein [Solirubrobacteraceae bacterium]
MRVVYNSYEGRFSDSPRAICEALGARGDGYEHVWLTDPAHRDGFPAGVATVEYGTPESIAALESADVVVANTHTDLVWRKRPGAFYLQTWHGTPLKRIHWDVLWAPEGRLDRLQRDVDQWDCLLSPNAASTPLLRRAFHYEGEVLESGYPRNDLLSSPGRDAVRERVRRQLGIPDGATAVLYTPTWRDDVVFGVEGAEFGLALDVAAFDERLGDDHVLLLRTHYMLTGRLAATEHASVRDVSFHPDVAELYLAADVMVTDYSSTMFDFAVTGRPMLFFTYDLEDYARRQRGFYFDLASVAPGPMVETTAALLDALEELPAVRERYAEVYARFRERFCHLEDGRATERVVERVLRAA